MTRKKKIILSAAFLLIISGGVWWYRSGQEPEILPTDTVKRGSVVETVSVTGELIPERYADLSFPMLGTIDEVLVTEGERVERGKPLTTLDQSVLLAQQNEALTALRIAEEEEKLARRGWQHLKPEERDAKKLATEQMRDKVRTLSTQIDESVIVAPFAGRVTRLEARSDEIATAGETLVRLVASDQFFVRARVPESDIAKIREGMKAEMTFDAFSVDEIFLATVRRMETSATVIQDVVSYEVEFALERDDPRLRDGMTATVDIETTRRDDVLTVPFRALSREGGRNFVEVQKGPGVFERREVTIGVEGDEGTVEILSGLSAGETVTIGARQAK